MQNSIKFLFLIILVNLYNKYHLQMTITVLPDASNAIVRYHTLEI